MISLENLFPGDGFLVLLFHPSLFKETYLILSLNKIKITTLNLRAMLLIFRFSSSVCAEHKCKGGRHLAQNNPSVWEYPVVYLGVSVSGISVCVQHSAKYCKEFKDI